MPAFVEIKAAIVLPGALRLNFELHLEKSGLVLRDHGCACLLRPKNRLPVERDQLELLVRLPNEEAKRAHEGTLAHEIRLRAEVHLSHVIHDAVAPITSELPETEVLAAVREELVPDSLDQNALVLPVLRAGHQALDVLV